MFILVVNVCENMSRKHKIGYLKNITLKFNKKTSSPEAPFRAQNAGNSVRRLSSAEPAKSSKPLSREEGGKRKGKITVECAGLYFCRKHPEFEHTGSRNILRCFHVLISLTPSPPLDNIRVMVTVWRLRGNIIRTALCWIV